MTDPRDAALEAAREALAEIDGCEVPERCCTLCFTDELAQIDAALAARPEPMTREQAEAGVAVGPEWKPCRKLPVTVHVREQRPGETHVSTREGITPVQPDDLIMRGVAGEEYPIGRELFQRTYRLGTADAQPQAEMTIAEAAKILNKHVAGCGDAWIGPSLDAILEAFRMGLEASRAAPAVPEGWKLVPVHPDKAMMDAAYTYLRSCRTKGETVMYHQMWSAMLAAAPTPPVASAAPAWIACSERMPEPWVPVLLWDVRVLGGNSKVGEWDDCDRVWSTEDGEYHVDSATHWTPLPPAPTPGGEG